MPDQILVPLNKRDRIEEISRCLDLLAQPGMTVTFLVLYREKVSWMGVQLTAINTGIRTAGNLMQLVANASRQEQLCWLEEKVVVAREALQRKGIRARVHCYNGSFESAIASLREPDTETIVLLSEHYRVVRNCMAWAKTFTSRFKTEQTPVLFLRPYRQN
jgi:hypothetical protein